ncbi:hypothetical protein [Mariprofundus ferrooxydans]|uniref:Uncharacterized protein n=1 Tax=Mariprofundus ferrooxydans PV-1 TaxID=314345 RepID=Q0EZB9_9PROT|nr:hypothetical protein [Mariprofundus ferrooxydans]EAU54505.1 hypothetical protein SPV1_07416 [Mariprofundus ferrooxydans PV-1]KON48864.1 hypothetical protein AL013_00575 [Mariprofundus ferrooxydans]
MAFIFTALLTLLAMEYFLRLPFLPRIRAVIRISNRVAHVLPSAVISDHWKEKVLLRYAGALMYNSMILLLMLVGCLLMIGGFAWLADRIAGVEPTTISVISSLPGMILMVAISIPYICFRKWYVDQ